MKARFCFSIRLDQNRETMTTPPIEVEAIGPKAFEVEGVNVFQEFGAGEWVITRRLDVKRAKPKED